MKVKNSLNANDFEKNYREIKTPSLTVPDQTMSMRTILERYARGLPVGGRTDMYYDEDDDMPDVRTLDLAEIQELRESSKEIIEKYSHKKQVVENNGSDSVQNQKTDETES